MIVDQKIYCMGFNGVKIELRNNPLRTRLDMQLGTNDVTHSPRIYMGEYSLICQYDNMAFA